MNDILKGTIIETYVNHIIVRLQSGKKLKVGNKYLKFYPSVRDKVVIYHVNNTYKVFKETVANFNIKKAGSLFLVSFTVIYGLSLVVNNTNVELLSSMLNDNQSVSKADMKDKANAFLTNMEVSFEKDMDKVKNTLSK